MMNLYHRKTMTLTIVAIIFITLSQRATCKCIPSEGSNAAEPPRNAFLQFNRGLYFTFRVRYETHVLDGLASVAAERRYVHIFRILCLISAGRLASNVTPSGVWDNTINVAGHLGSILPDIGFLHDDLSIGLVREIPS